LQDLFDHSRYCHDYTSDTRDGAEIQATQTCAGVGGTWSLDCPCPHGSIGGCRFYHGDTITRWYTSLGTLSLAEARAICVDVLRGTWVEP
jgi:hypothetical protein